MIDFRVLVKAGVHFGHQKNRWCPKMAPYIWGTKNNIHLIDVSKTAFLLEQAAKFLQQTAAEGKTILWVGTKKAAKLNILKTAQELSMPYVNHRWIGGTLSNFGQVKKSVTRCLHYEDVVSKSGEESHYTKKEFNTFQKIVDRLEKNIGGIKKLAWPIGAMVVVDVYKEQAAVKEAIKMGIPVVGLVDTNCDPTNISYVIPTNDDVPRAINVIMDYLKQSVLAGVETAALKKEKEAALALEKQALKKQAQELKRAKSAPAKSASAKGSAPKSFAKTNTPKNSAVKSSVKKPAEKPVEKVESKVAAKPVEKKAIKESAPVEKKSAAVKDKKEKE